MKSYFFIPANKETFLENVSRLNASEFIIDLEDALFNKEIGQAIKNIDTYNISPQCYIRIPFFSNRTNKQFNEIQSLFKAGFFRFVLPKIETANDVKLFIDFFQTINTTKSPELIVLIENPSAIEKLNKIIENKFIRGIALGSHDYCAITGIKHSSENILWARMQILNAGKAKTLEVIDIASMTINDEAKFAIECIDGFEKGHDGKFIIHPWQLAVFNRQDWYSEREIQHAISVKKHVENIKGVKNFSIAKIDGVIVEKPHLKRINEILKHTGNGSI